MKQIHTIKALSDNYIFILESTDSRDVIIIDPSEAMPVIRFCKEHQFHPTHIINTHHHWDHVGGNLDLQKRYGLEILCFESDKSRTPGATRFLKDNEMVNLHSWKFQTLHIPGHTLGQIALYSAEEQVVFVGDTLFRFGCGRIFEGDAPMMYSSLKKLTSLPEDTLIYCGHEYGLRNLNFLEQNDASLNSEAIENLRKQLKNELEKNSAAVPFSLKEQIHFNPFLKASSAEGFKKWRLLRDNF